MSQPQNLYAWANGLNVPLNSLTVITSRVAPGDTLPFPAPACRGFFTPGSPKKRTDRKTFYSGNNASALYWEALSWNQYTDIYTTILNSSFSDNVTLLMRIGFDSYSRMNVVLDLPPQANTDGKFFAPKKVKCPVIILGAAS